MNKEPIAIAGITAVVLLMIAFSWGVTIKGKNERIEGLLQQLEKYDKGTPPMATQTPTPSVGVEEFKTCKWAEYAPTLFDELKRGDDYSLEIFLSKDGKLKVYDFPTSGDKCVVDVGEILYSILHKSDVSIKNEGLSFEYVGQGRFAVEQYTRIFIVDIVSEKNTKIVDVTKKAPLEVTSTKPFYFDSTAYFLYEVEPNGLGCGDETSCAELEKHLSYVCKWQEHGLWIYDVKKGTNTRLHPATFLNCE